MSKNFLDQTGLGQVLLSVKRKEQTTSPSTSAVSVITADGITNKLTIWIGYRGTEPDDIPDGTLKFYLKQ
jgi:hypothetical protein